MSFRHMKYEPGDKVKIKTWKDMEKKYGLNKDEDITPPPPDQPHYIFSLEKEKFINENYPDRIFTISHINNYHSYYIVKETEGWLFEDWMIEGLTEKPILSRFEILDI